MEALKTSKRRAAIVTTVALLSLTGCLQQDSNLPDTETRTSSIRAAGPIEGGTSVHAKNKFDNVKPAPVRLAALQLPRRVTTEIVRPTAGGPLRREATGIVDFDTAPFPYDGRMPRSATPFLNVSDGERRGHRTARGRVLWEDEIYSDNGVLLHIPKGFDARKPAVAIMFFHGHGAKLDRDVRDRQLVPSQISASGANAVLMAPQFANAAADSSAGRFWEPGACEEFRQEAAQKFAAMYGDPRSAKAFNRMPVVIVAYSGGFVPAAWCLHHGRISNEIRGVILLDALYGEFDKYANWISKNRSAFFLSAYTTSTRRGNGELQRMLTERDIPHSSALGRYTRRGDVTFVQTPSDVDHRSYVTRAWTESPLKDALVKLEEYRR
ncbi:MAG TPA: alpha/beta hydrolase [Xanthobacteraceae bacterium]|nr:alpha/beta hydrolase [Xanthobacteraceae bacterium]